MDQAHKQLSCGDWDYPKDKVSTSYILSVKTSKIWFYIPVHQRMSWDWKQLLQDPSKENLFLVTLINLTIIVYIFQSNLKD